MLKCILLIGHFVLLIGHLVCHVTFVFERMVMQVLCLLAISLTWMSSVCSLAILFMLFAHWLFSFHNHLLIGYLFKQLVMQRWTEEFLKEIPHPYTMRWFLLLIMINCTDWGGGLT